MAHLEIPATGRQRLGESKFQANLGKKFLRPTSTNKKAEHMACGYHPSSKREDGSPGHPGINSRPYSGKKN
jgi:hypothetical protein